MNQNPPSPSSEHGIEKTKSAFLHQCTNVPIANIIPLKSLRPAVKSSLKYMQILASIKEVGLIEPPAVVPDPNKQNHFLLLDGHLRIEALKDLGSTAVDCIIATDDDTYSYNKRINRLAAVQDHKMIVNAIERGVSAERIGSALDLSPETVRQRFRLLDGICAEAAEILSDKPCPAHIFRILKKMKPIRQIEAAELMEGQRNYSLSFATAILASTTAQHLVTEHNKKTRKSDDALPSSDSMERLERELAALQTQNKAIEDSYGPDILHLTVIRGYLGGVLSCASIVNWLAKNQPDYLREFQKIAEMSELPFSKKN